MQGVLQIDGVALEFASIEGPTDAPCIVFLHEGLGSIGLWKDFPTRVCLASRCPGMVYSRRGYGNSDPLQAPRRTQFMHEEAQVILPRVLAQLGIFQPIVVGHSDGASIALIFAATAPAAVRATVVMAPHVMVEPIALQEIAAARAAYREGSLKTSLSRHHRDVDSAFYGWNDVWLSPEFRNWDIRALLPQIRCPLLAIQGFEDAYGTMAQLEAIGASVPQANFLRLSNCGHSPQRDRSDEVVGAIAKFVGALDSVTLVRG